MKFGVQISDGCFDDFITLRRTSFEENEQNLFNEFQKLLKTADLYVDGDLSMYDLNEPIWKYFGLLMSGAGNLERQIKSKQLYQNNLNEVSKKYRKYFFEEDQAKSGHSGSVFCSSRSSVPKEFGNVSCCKSDNRLNSISIRRNSDFAKEKWKVFNQFKHPTSSILVYDPYLFKGSIGRDIDSRFKKTLIPLIRSISRSTKVISHIELIGSLHHFVGNRADDEIWVNQKIDRLQAYLEEIFFQNGFKVAPRICLHKKRLEHDRRLLTDYIQIKPGSSFEFFNQFGHIPVQGFTVHVAPLYHNDIQKDVQDFKRALGKEIDLTHLNL